MNEKQSPPFSPARYAARIALLSLAALAAGALAGAAPGWVRVAPLRQVADPRLGKLLSDIESQMPAQHIYRDRDLVTWAHETTHGINSRVRNQLAAGTGRANACYVAGAGVAMLLPEPRLRKSQVAPLVAPEFRDSTYALYVAGQSAWDAEPLYLLDEWSAYANGTAVGLELAAAGQWRAGERSETTEHMLEFCGFAAALVAAVRQRDPAYPARAELVAFVRWQILRSVALARAAERCPDFDSPRAHTLRAAIEQRIGAAP